MYMYVTALVVACAAFLVLASACKENDQRCIFLHRPRFLTQCETERADGSCQNAKLTRPRSDQRIEIAVTYDAQNAINPLCGIGQDMYARKICQWDIVAPQDMAPPILVYYEIEGWNGKCPPHVKHSETVDGDERSECMFNDLFTLSSGRDKNGADLVMMEEGIASRTDLEMDMFQQPETFDLKFAPSKYPWQKHARAMLGLAIIPTWIQHLGYVSATTIQTTETLVIRTSYIRIPSVQLRDCETSTTWCGTRSKSHPGSD